MPGMSTEDEDYGELLEALEPAKEAQAAAVEEDDADLVAALGSRPFSLPQGSPRAGGTYSGTMPG